MIYSIFITLFIQTFSCISFYAHRMYTVKIFLLFSKRTVVVELIVLMNCISWIILNNFSMMTILWYSDVFCKLLNEFRDVEKFFGNKIPQKIIEKRVKIAFYTCITFSGLGLPLVVLKSYGLTPLGLFTTMRQYFQVSQFFAGYLYEFMFFEYLQVLHIENNKRVDSSSGVRQMIELHEKLRKLSKRLTKLFQISKVAGLTASLVLMSIFWFYAYAKKSLWTIIWQAVVSLTFVVCHSWHRINEQVSGIISVHSIK